MNRHLLLSAITVLACTILSSTGFAGGKDFHDQDLKNKNFDDASLNGADFSDAVLDHAAFNRASLKKANFNGAEITFTNFYLADLTEADLHASKGTPWLSETTLNKANLEGLTLTFSGACKLRGANLKDTKIQSVGSGCDFSDADLRGANLRAAHLTTNVRFKNAIYNDDTAWPDGFDPKAAGAVMKADDDKKSDEKKSDDKKDDTKKDSAKD